MTGERGVRAAIALRQGTFDLDVDLDAPAGETVALLGPNGSGKTTILRCIAGLTPLGRGRIEIDGVVVDDPAAGVHRPPRERAVGMVFQDHLLFPSLSVLENVAFGLRARGTERQAARRRAADLIDAVGLTAHAAARPAQLSGGQRQRVALARALATDPAVVLLDEPLAALDATTRDDVRRELRTRLASVAGARVLVTHDAVDAFALADRVIVVEGGRVTHRGPLAEVAARPRTAYLADLLGLDLLRGEGHGDRVVVGADAGDGGGAGVEIRVGQPVDGPAFVAVRPHRVRLVDVDRDVDLDRDRDRAGAGASGRSGLAATFDGVVERVDLRPDRVLVTVRAGAHGPEPGVTLTAAVDPAEALDRRLAPGRPVAVEVPPDAVTAYPD